MTSPASMVRSLPQALFGRGASTELARPALGTGTVVAYTQGLRGFSSQHEQVTRMEVVRRLAQLKGCDVGAEFAQPPGGKTYLVPSDTLVGHERAISLGVVSRDDLFGGVVPLAFIATKAITHPLLTPESAAPDGWRHDFHPAIAAAVLQGYSVFARTDAHRAGRMLLDQHKAVRIKLVQETGGRGQSVVRRADDLDTCLDAVDDDSLQRFGLVMEQNLDPVETLSVGQVVAAGLTASYFGKQHLVKNNRGKEVYGGTELTVIRGNLEQLLACQLAPAVRTAVEQALAYDAAVSAVYPGFFASRTNYDIAQGMDAAGQWCSGVLEQSWRVGGATGAEIAALEVLASDPSANHVRTRCVEAYGAVTVPDGAALYFQGVDDRLGPMSKYAMVLPDGDPA